MPINWSEEELSAAVTAYRRMQRMETDGIVYQKKRVYERLSALYGRTTKAFEFRMQNISAVLNSAGQPWLHGLIPAANVGAGVTKKLQAILGIEPSLQNHGSYSSYIPKLGAMRSWLIGIARQRSVVRYGEMMAAFGVDRFSLRHALARLGHGSRNAGEPVLTAVVVSKQTGRCSEGIEVEFGIVDDALERTRLYSYWAMEGVHATKTGSNLGELGSRAAKFALMSVRPDQAAFRRAIFEAYFGYCCISGCDVDVALDAAHKTGRDWRLGYNSASDGYLLRKDLHALYDRGLLTIANNGRVGLLRQVQAHYKTFDKFVIDSRALS